MTSYRQIEANRRNALLSTGPRTEEGKLESRRNALRHGLTAETVIEILEDPEDYKGFEANIIADYDARTAVAGELVLRLSTLLTHQARQRPRGRADAPARWRSRAATTQFDLSGAPRPHPAPLGARPQ